METRDISEIVGGAALVVITGLLPGVRQFFANMWVRFVRPPGAIDVIRHNAAIDVSVHTSIARLLGAAAPACRVGVCQVHDGIVDTARFHILKFSAVAGECSPGVATVKAQYQEAPFSEYPFLVQALTGPEPLAVLCKSELPPGSREHQDLANVGCNCVMTVRLMTTVSSNLLSHFLILMFDECSTENCIKDDRKLQDRVMQAAAEISAELRRRKR